MQRSAYKSCKTAQELNELTRYERDTRCGYANYHWSQSGVCASSIHKGRDNFIHTRMKTFRTGLNEVLTDTEVEELLKPYEGE